MDDRKSKLQRDEREKELREARAVAAAKRAAQQQTAPEAGSTPPPPSASDRMPGAGHVLGLTAEDPPAYHEDEDDEDSE